MKSDKGFDDAPAGTLLPSGSGGEKLQRDPVISRSRQTLHGRNVDRDVLPSNTMEFRQPSVRNVVVRKSRMLAWDNQRIFGPALETRSSRKNSESEAK
jgi:hypothetical protein